MTAIGNDAAFQDVDDDVVDAFLERLMPDDAGKKKDQPSETVEGQPVVRNRAPEEDEERDDTPSDTQTDDDQPTDQAADTQDDTDTGDKPNTDDIKYADEDTYAKVKVGDEEHAVPLKDLTRLYGQEQALTKKSMEVADQRRKVDAELAVNVAAHSQLLDRAKQRWEPYSKIDFLLAAKELSAEDYTSLRTAAQAAYEDMNFLQNGLNQFVQAAQERQNNSLVEQAKDALKVLAGPVDQGGIEGWNEQKYDSIREFAYSAGLKKEIVDNLVDPVAIKLLNDAMLFRRGQSKVVVTRKVNKTPTKVIKTRQAPNANTGAPDKTKEASAAKRLRATGSADDAAELFLARWANRDAELN